MARDGARGTAGRGEVERRGAVRGRGARRLRRRGRILVPPLDVVDCGPRYKACGTDPAAVAAHGDSVLFEMSHVAGSNYFVYTAGAPARPPALSPVPALVARRG